MSEEFPLMSGVHINDGPLEGFATANKRFDMVSMLEKPTFRVADTDLTYRLVSILEAENLLPEHSQKTKGSWRAFSIKDYVYLLAIIELKSFGVKNNQLRNVYESFYGKYRGFSTEALGCVLGHIEIVGLFYKDGVFVIADMDNCALIENDSRNGQTFLKISFNNLVGRVLNQIPSNKMTVEARQSGAMRVMSLDETVLTAKELEALSIIRDDKYSSVTISKKDGIPNKVTAKNVIAEYGEERALDKAVADMIRSKNFGAISITKRNGKVVNVVNEDTIRI